MSEAQDPTSPEAAAPIAAPAAAPPAAVAGPDPALGVDAGATSAPGIQPLSPRGRGVGERGEPRDLGTEPPLPQPLPREGGGEQGPGVEAPGAEAPVGGDSGATSVSSLRDEGLGTEGSPSLAGPEQGEAAAELVPAREPAAVTPEMSPAACAERLAALFPALFGGEGPPKPVKLRIHADIQQRAPGVFTRKALSIFMHRHTTGNAYLKALLTAPHRHDLDGQPAGEVAEEHRAAAKEELERRRQIALARRAAGRGPGAGRGAPGSGPRGPGDPTGLPLPDPAGPPDAPRAPRTEAAPRRERQGPGRPDQPRTAGAPAARPPRAGGRPQGDRRPDNRPENRLPNRPGRRPEHGPERRAGPRPEQRPEHRPDPGFQGRPADDTRRVQPESAPAGPEDAARRERAALLRTYEASSLSKANFCALKRLGEAELDGLLNQARQEREARGAAAATPRG